MDEVILPEMEQIDLNNAIQSALANRMEIELSGIGVDVSKVLLRYERETSYRILEYLLNTAILEQMKKR